MVPDFLPRKFNMADFKADAEQKTHKIDCNLRKQILAETLQCDENFVGILVGDEREGCCDVIGCIRCTYYENAGGEENIFTCRPDWVKEVAEICTLIPTGILICGVCYVSKSKPVVEPSSIEEIFSGADVENELINIRQMLWLVDQTSEENESATLYIHSLSNKTVHESCVVFEDIVNDFVSKHVTLRLRHKFQLSVEESNDVDISMSLSKKITLFCNQLHDATFYLPQCGLLIHKKVMSPKTCGEILDDVITENDESSYDKSNRHSRNREKDILNVQVVRTLSNKVSSHNHAPIFFCQKEESNYMKFVISVDVLIMVAMHCSISKLAEIFVRGIKDQLQGLLSCIDKYSKDYSFSIPKVFHFKTAKNPYLTTCIYPWKKSNGTFFDEKDFENERCRLLKKVLLPAQRPTLHPNNNFMFQNARSEGDGCHVAVVDGSYSYHHYMQDNFDDNKWGCAYRSLQTIFSWFRHQGYTNKKIPDHRAVQEALVALGDKQTSFIGSRKWIGSFEVSLCLDYFLDVSCKIMAVNSGAELQNKGRELLRHFESQGTPVMIGGGVLAHTILGVSFNDRTGEIKFLILDPHYTGGENIKIVLEKGWCGWKNHMFWNQQAHYNLCMPQRPAKI